MSTERAPDAITIRKSEGAYLDIFPDGSARAGFGALAACADIPKGTFDFSHLLQTDLREDHVANNEKRTSNPSYIAVGFLRNSSAVMYHFDNRTLISDLFEHAKRNAMLIRPDIICPFRP